MKTFTFVIDFIDDFTGQSRTMTKEYRTKDYESAKKGINQYLESNKTIHAVLSCIVIDDKEF